MEEHALRHVAIVAPRGAAAPLVRVALPHAASRLTEAAGGPARRRIIVLLAAVLALNSADLATVGAVAGQLRDTLGVSNADIGLLASASAVVAAIATVPIGVLADRVCRTCLLSGSIVVWGLAMIAAGASSSFEMLLISRLALGAVLATAGPAIASLTGDFFAPAERGRVYGLILGGELLGTGLGFAISGQVAAALSWRWAFWALALPSFALAWAIRERLPEPARGGAGRVPVGARELAGGASGAAMAPHHIWSVAPIGPQTSPDPMASAGEGATAPASAGDDADSDVLWRLVSEREIPAREETVLRVAPERLGLVDAVRYVLRVRTNVVLIAASALGYFFFAGLRTFGAVSMQDRFGLTQSAATSLLTALGVGALLGVSIAGRLADRQIARGRLDARLVVAAGAYLAAAAFLVPGLLLPSFALAAPLLFLAAAGLGAPNPPLDAARLDVVPARLWGRAEAIRTVLRTLAEAIAPFVFGVLADALGGAGARAGAPTGPGGFEQGGGAPGSGLRDTFLIMTIPLLLSAAILFRGRRDYPSDVASAIASSRQAPAAAPARTPPAPTARYSA